MITKTVRKMACPGIKQLVAHYDDIILYIEEGNALGYALYNSTYQSI
jgi:hypothetical protein